MGFEEEMAELDEEWSESASKPRTGGNMLPIGKHQVGVAESRVEQQEDGRWTWVIKMKNEDGSIRKFQNLDHEVGRDIAAGDAAIMGYSEGSEAAVAHGLNGKLSHLQKACEAGIFDDLVLDINIQPSKKQGNDRDFVNIYINRCLGKGEPVAADDFAPTGAMDDDIPF